jgi:hypothetical protein
MHVCHPVQVSTHSGSKTLNIRPETLKLMGKTLELIRIGNDFLNRTQKAQQQRERIDTGDYMKLKKL